MATTDDSATDREAEAFVLNKCEAGHGPSIWKRVNHRVRAIRDDGSVLCGCGACLKEPMEFVAEPDEEAIDCGHCFGGRVGGER